MTAAAASGQTILLRPHPLFVIVEPWRHYGWIAALGALSVLGAQAWTWTGLSGAPGRAEIVLGAALLIGLRFLWAVADWASRLYGLSDGLVWAQRGVLSRRREESPLDGVRSMVVVKPLEQRVFGMGSVGFATAGTSGYEVVWFIIGSPDRALAAVRAASRTLEAAA